MVAPGVTTIAVPGPDLTITPPPGEFNVSERDWHRLYRDVESLENPIGFANNLGWSAVGILLTAAFFALSWNYSYPSLPRDTQQAASWVLPVTVVIVVAAIVIAVVCFVMNYMVEKRLRTDVAAVLGYMNEMHVPHTPDASQSPPQSSSSPAISSQVQI